MAKETLQVNNSLEEYDLIDHDSNENKKGKKKEDKKVKTEKPEKEKKSKKKNKENTSKNKKEGYFAKIKKEMSLVTWPSRKSVVKYSFATIIMILLLAVFFIGLSALFDLLYALVQGWIG